MKLVMHMVKEFCAYLMAIGTMVTFLTPDSMAKESSALVMAIGIVATSCMVSNTGKESFYGLAALVTTGTTGKGVYRYANGDMYDGYFLDGKHHVKGVFSYANGNRYIGGFEDGQQHGLGVFTYANGSYFEGCFIKGKMTTGHLHLADIGIRLAATFHGGDDFNNDGERLYHLALMNDDGYAYKEGGFSDGKFV